MISVIIIEDNKIIQIGLSKILLELSGLQVVGLADNCEQMFDLIRSGIETDVVLINCTQVKPFNYKKIEQFLKNRPHTNILVLTSDSCATDIKTAFNYGVKGYLHQDLNPEELLFAIRHVFHGHSYLSSNLATGLVDQCSSLIQEYARPSTDLLSAGYSEREIEVLNLIAQGYTNNEIGEKLFLSKRTVEGHRQSLLLKSGMKNTPQLVYYMSSKGALKPMESI